MNNLRSWMIEFMKSKSLFFNQICCGLSILLYYLPILDPLGPVCNSIDLPLGYPASHHLYKCGVCLNCSLQQHIAYSSKLYMYQQPKFGTSIRHRPPIAFQRVPFGQHATLAGPIHTRQGPLTNGGHHIVSNANLSQPASVRAPPQRFAKFPGAPDMSTGAGSLAARGRLGEVVITYLSVVVVCRMKLPPFDSVTKSLPTPDSTTPAPTAGEMGCDRTSAAARCQSQHMEYCFVGNGSSGHSCRGSVRS